MAKVKVGVTLVPPLFCAPAMNCRTLPTCREALLDGFRVIRTGNGDVAGGLCPPQAGRNKNKKMVTTTDAD